jgi:hypothetical protein
MGQRTAGDLMFEAYLAEQGYGEAEHEPELGVGKYPDYMIERNGRRCVVEIKEFSPDSSPFPDRPGLITLDAKTVLKPIRGQLREAARKFKAMEKLGLPLIVMLANPRGVALDLSIENIIQSMYGDLTYTFPVSAETGGATEPGQFVAGRNGRYRADHQYVSAVGLLSSRDRRAERISGIFAEHRELPMADLHRLLDEADARGEVPDGTYHTVTLVKSASETAVPVPDQFFDGEQDRVFEYEEDSGGYVQARGPVRS